MQAAKLLYSLPGCVKNLLTLGDICYDRESAAALSSYQLRRFQAVRLMIIQQNDMRAFLA